MPVPTPEQMRAYHPAFSLVDDGVVASALARGYERSAGLDAPESVKEEAAMYMAAHLVASDPMAEPSSRSAIREDGGSVYMDHWLALLKQYRGFGTVEGIP